ncbi:hypothetical protein M569_05182, partial [Genlisea aurea]
RPVILSFKTTKSQKTALIAAPGSEALPLDDVKIQDVKKSRKLKKRPECVKAVPTDEASSSTTLDLDYNEAAAKLEKIYKRSPASVVSDEEEVDNGTAKRKRPQRKRKSEHANAGVNIVRSTRNKTKKRLNLNERISLRMKVESDSSATIHRKNVPKSDDDQKISRLLREYSASADLSSLDWKKMKIPPVLPSSEHTWLFKLMQPMKETNKVKETLKVALGREPTDYELAEAMNMDPVPLRKRIEVGRASRNKLIRHNLRLVLFVMNKYFQDFSNGPKFQDLCQAGVKGLITAIDRFEPKRKSRLSTYGLFWIRHAVVRSMTLSSFTKVSFGLESIRAEIQKTKMELMVKLQRRPTDEEIMNRVGISEERYREVMRVTKPVSSLNARHELTNEEFIAGISDADDVEGDRRKELALLRLAIDDVLDSLKPKEGLVIRQRYGLDGKGDRTLGEVAGNLNISREMVRKHEVKALMKLKHPARVDYLRRYIFK